MQRNEEQNGRAQLKYADRTLPLDVTTEITLPDYRSEISRLLWVRPVFLPPARYVGNGKIDFSGPVCYHILYVGPDGGLYGADSEGSYGISLARESVEGFDQSQGIETAVELTPDAVISRVLGPRKVSVRSRLHARVQCYANKDLTPRLHGESMERIHRLCDAVENGRMMVSEVEALHLSDDVVPEQGSGELRVISARGTLFLPEVGAAEDGVRCRGEALITLLCCREEGEEDALPFAITRRIPFEKLIPLAGIMPDWRAMATGEVGHITATVEGDAIALGADVSLVAQAQCEESVLIYKDVFVPGSRAECRSAEEPLWGCGYCGNRNFSVSGTRSFSELGMSADSAILDAVADAEIKEKQNENGRTILLGELRCHVLYRRGGEYETGEFSLPFRWTMEESADDAALLCHVISCRVTQTAEGLRADAEIGLALRACRHNTAACLLEATFTAAERPARADLEICYPCAEDSLWSVCKRYGVSPDALALANGLTGEEPASREALRGVKYLLVP